ncbi:MAG: hypothetical protein K2Q18_15950, partial [Bdellovibrionales bacterium]|nr:hypothetical protein [Bdellovibrionales bacterium]
KRTPWHFEENKNNETALFNINELVTTSLAIRDFFGVEIDIEWAVDLDDNLKILQARPITALSGKSEERRMIAEELARLNKNYPSDTLWDGATFAEWSGPPSELTFSIWKKAFAKGQAFSTSLKKLGYLGIDQELTNDTHSLLEKIFDRPFINVSMIAPLYFGPIPYHLEDKNGPKLKFDFRKMTLKMFLLTPLTIYRMIKISLQLSTQRHKWLTDCSKELSDFSKKSFRVGDINYYKNFSDEKLFSAFKEESDNFYSSHLVWPLVLASLIQSTTLSLQSLLKSLMTDKEIEQKINHWLGIGLHSITMDMNQEYAEACIDVDKHTHFLSKYGHRGPGELELSNPRWIEMGNSIFFKLNSKPLNAALEKNSVISEIRGLKTYKMQVIEKEWLLLSEMLELREKWKMNLLSPYSHIRFMALEIAKRYNVGIDIFWFSVDEILSKKFDLDLAHKRKNHVEISKSIYLPSMVSLSSLEQVLSNKESRKDKKVLVGEALSPGLVFGEVRVVSDPENIDTDSWPENTILIAESTDPGWTGLFLKSKAIVVEKGGVLSHCAIVAREMNLPAVSRIKQCHLQFRDGDKIWVDGNNGRITLA